MTNTVSRTLGLIGVAMLISGCAGPDQGSDEAGGSMADRENVAGQQATAGQVDRRSRAANAASTRSLADVETEAIADLQQRVGSAGRVLVVSAERVTWPDGSAGCPRAGMVYTQALVPGTRVVLEWQDKNYYYHGRGMGLPRLCADSPGQPVEAAETS